MSDHPNATAAAVATLLTIGTQWLIQRYAHAALSDYWKSAITGTATVTVLYIGKHGVKSALSRVLNGPKAAWNGTAPAAAGKKG